MARTIVIGLSLIIATSTLSQEKKTENKEKSKSTIPSSSFTEKNIGPSKTFLKLEAAYGYHSGITGTSFSGQKFSSFLLGVEEKNGSLRFSANLAIEIMKNAALSMGPSLTSTTLNYTGFKIGAGLAIYPMQGSVLQPFISAEGHYTRGGVDASPGTAELADFFRPNLYGYELSFGFDLKASLTSAPRLRVRGVFTSESGTFSSISNFKATSVKLSLGTGF